MRVPRPAEPSARRRPRPHRPPLAAPATAAAFVACLRQSGLVEADTLDAFLDGREDLGAKALARDAVREKHLTKWQADKLLAGRCRGFKLGSYTLLSLLGKGGMSAVYLGEHSVMRRKCAVKVLPAKMLGGGSHLERFLREARAVAALDHPNVVRAYDVASEGEGSNATYYLVMELVVGRSLYDLVKREGPPGAGRVRRIGREVAKGLAHAHAAGIVHRDVKPGNVLLANSGAVKVTDLGLARGDDEEHSLTVAHDEKVLGTADYLAPEQALDSHAVDHRADVYGLGCTLYFALCGHGPFTDGTLAQRLLAHQNTPAPPIETVAENVPADLAAAVGRMLEKDPTDRFQTMDEVAAALSEATAGGEGGPPTPAPAGSGAAGEPTERELSDFLAGLGPAEEGSGTTQSGVRPAVKSGRKRGRGGSGNRSGGRGAAAAGGPDEPFAVADDEPTPLPRPDAGAARVRPGGDRGRGRNSKPKWPLIAAAVAGLAVAAAVWAAFPGGDGEPADEGGRDPEPEAVAGTGDDAPPASPDGDTSAETAAADVLTVGDGGDFPTLAAALGHLRETYDPAEDEVRTIELPAGTLPEALRLDNTDFSVPAGLRVVGADGGTTLAPPDDGPAISLRAVNRFALENVAVDAAGRAVGAELGGFLTDCSVFGLRVENVGGGGVGGAVGLLLDGVAANRLPVENLSVAAADVAADAVAVRLAGTGVGGVTFAGGELAGPFASGVAVEAAAANLTLDGLTVGPAAAGVRFGAVELGQVVLRNLTFRDVTTALRFTGEVDGDGGLTLESLDYGDAGPVDAGPAPDSVRDALGDAAAGLLD